MTELKVMDLVKFVLVVGAPFVKGTYYRGLFGDPIFLDINPYMEVTHVQ